MTSPSLERAFETGWQNVRNSVDAEKSVIESIREIKDLDLLSWQILDGVITRARREGFIRSDFTEIVKSLIVSLRECYVSKGFSCEFERSLDSFILTSGDGFTQEYILVKEVLSKFKAELNV